MKKPRKIILYTLTTIILIVVLVLIFISPITKYLIQKYDEKYTGRQITLGWTYINPFTGYIHFSDLKIYESKSDSVFFSAKGISANISMFKLFSKNYEISKLIIDKPKGKIIQNKKEFNFNDLITKFTSKKAKPKSIKEQVHFSLLNIKINDGTFYYTEKVTPINYFIKNVNIFSEGFRWNIDSIPIKFSFSSGIGTGDAKGEFILNSKNNDYRLAVLVNRFDLNIVGQYVKDLSNYGSFKAYLDADFKSNGNLIHRDDVTNSGLIQINDFHFGKNPEEDYASFEKLTVKILEVSPRKRKYLFDSVSLKKPYFKYEKYDHLDNIQTIFGKKGSKVKAANSDPNKFNLVIEIAKYIKTLSKNLISSNYKANRVAIYQGNIIYNDYSLNEKFCIGLNPLNFIADSIDKKHKRIKFNLWSGINPYGNISLNVSVNPKDSSDFDLYFQFKKIPITLFNPFIIKYTSFPLDRGTVEVNGVWHVQNGAIQSTNNLTVIDPRLGKRIRNKNSKWLPMRILMFFVRERGNVIDYEVPITGNLKDPKFNLRDVIFDVLENIFIKPVTTPYRIEVRNIETQIEKTLALKWEMKSCELTRNQIKFIERIANFLEENPDAKINVYPQIYTLKEKEYILFYEAKKKYYFKSINISNSNFTEKDSLIVDKMSAKDSLFLRYLSRNVNDSMLFTVQDRCIRLLGPNYIETKYTKLNRDRQRIFMSYFEEKNLTKQIKIVRNKNVVPYNGFSFYKIDYKGEFPDYLLKAYSKMNELNNEAPRDKFKKQRNYRKNIL